MILKQSGRSLIEAAFAAKGAYIQGHGHDPGVSLRVGLGSRELKLDDTAVSSSLHLPLEAWASFAHSGLSHHPPRKHLQSNLAFSKIPMDFSDLPNPGVGRLGQGMCNRPQTSKTSESLTSSRVIHPLFSSPDSPFRDDPRSVTMTLNASFCRSERCFNQ